MRKTLIQNVKLSFQKIFPTLITYIFIQLSIRPMQPLTSIHKGPDIVAYYLGLFIC